MCEIIYAVPFTNSFYHLYNVKVAHKMLQKNAETTGMQGQSGSRKNNYIFPA